jgi:hypothetical protein
MDPCPICFEPVDDTTGHCTLSCKHVFHIACLTKWGKETASCPMCRRSLGATEVEPAPPPREFWTEWIGGRRWHIISSSQAVETMDDPPPPEGPPPPENRIHHIQHMMVTESDIETVMEVSHVNRGAAVRALLQHDGAVDGAVSWLALPPLPPEPPVYFPPRDPMTHPADDQLTTWFIQRMFDEGESIPGVYNSYRDLHDRMRNGPQGRYWQHYEFCIDPPDSVDGYESA